MTAADLGELNGLLLQSAINRQARKHPRAAQLTYATLHAAMARALKLGFLERDPMAAVDKPHHEPSRAAVLTAAEMGQYLQAARSYDTYPLLLLMATCGLRRGEALGLTWKAIDTTTHTLHITQQRMRQPGKGLTVAPLKSKASNRILPLPPAIESELSQWRGSRKVRTLWVVDTTPETLRREHRAALAIAGLPPVTLHGLRHSMATIAAGDGVGMKVLQGILGHSHYQLTADLYADHLRPEMYAGHLARVAANVGF